MSMATSELQSVNSIQQFQNDSDPWQVDSQVISQVLDHAYPVERYRIQHDFGASNFRRFEQTKLQEPPNDVRMQSETSCSIFQRHQVSSSNDGDFVFLCFHFL